MPAGYDSWTDEIERGDGYALGGFGTHTRVKTRLRWRAAAAHLAGLVLLDLSILVVTAAAVCGALIARSLPLFVVAVVICTGTALWFRHQRLEHEKRHR